jgi:hypothetical protein
MVAYRGTFSGTLGGSEIFAFSFASALVGSSDIAAMLTAYNTWLNDFWTSPVANLFPSEVTINRLRVVQLTDTTGQVTDSREQGVTKVGTSTADSLPFEVACVVTLRTSTPGGKGRGRFYLPPPSTLQMTDGGVFSAGFVSALMTGLGSACDNFVTADRKMHVYGVGTGITNNLGVLSVEVGNVPDAQRRRRNKQVEARTSHTIAV